MAKQVSFEQFASAMEAAGIEVDGIKLRELAADSGTVDVATIPVLTSAELVEYTAKTGRKATNLYAAVMTFVQGKFTKAHYGRLANLRRDIAQMEAALPALQALEADLSEGAENTVIPAGWTITGDDAAGFVSSK